MTSNSKFFSDDKGPAAVLKHGVLRRYLATFAGATSSTSPGNRVGYLDGYAGEGEYLNPRTGITSDGSPKIALSIATDLRVKGRELRTVFVEKQHQAFRRLEAVVNSSGDPHALALHGDIGDHLAGALTTFSNMPALVFLDPFGSALDHAATVDAILKRPGGHPTELLLNFSLQALRRMGARIWEEEGRVGREATLARVDRWLGGDWWRAEFLSPEVMALPQSDRAHTAATNVAKAHRRKIIDATGCSCFSVPIRRRPSEKPIFELILFFPRRLAAFKFNEAVSMALKDWREFLHDVELTEADLLDETDPQQLLSRVSLARYIFDADEEMLNREAVDAIKKSITQALATRAKLSVRNDFGLVMGNGVGVGRTTHLRTAWKELAMDGLTEACPKGPLDSATIVKTN